jgi:bacterioferritin-associated ferredoxin
MPVACTEGASWRTSARATLTGAGRSCGACARDAAGSATAIQANAEKAQRTTRGEA